jgi:hypothetical protein
MTMMKTLPALLVVGWIAMPFLLEAAKAERQAPTADKVVSNEIAKADRIAAAFAVFASAKSGAAPAPTVTLVANDRDTQTSTVTRVSLVETASR